MRNIPVAAWMCALVAFLNAAAWGLLIPAFHVPDEPQHIAYAQHFAETGKLPGDPDRPDFSGEQWVAFDTLQFSIVYGNERARPPWTSAESRALEARLGQDLPRDDGGGSVSSANNPPLYYALEAVPYWAASSGSFLDRLIFMRLMSALLAGITALLCFCFLRELLPGTPWAWSVGALAVAFQPTVGFIGGGVSPDNLLFAASAGVFFLLARGFRRGVDPRWGLAFGGVLAAGLLTKGTMLGLVPAAGLGLIFLVLRADAAHRRLALRGAAFALGCAVALGLGYLALNELVWHRSLYPGTTDVATGGGARGSRSFTALIGYTWQFYLPRLPFMDDQWLGSYPLYDVWFRGLVGNFGWLDYQFPRWVYSFALAIALALLALVATTLVRSRVSLRRRWLELVTYSVAVAGLLALIAIAGYGHRADTGDVFEQTRYLFPLLPLYAALVALGTRAAGRAGPVLGAGFVVLAMAHGLFAQLLTLSRYYG